MVRLDFADDTDNLTDRALRKIVVVWQVVEERTFRQAVSPEAVRIVRNLMVVGVELLMNLIDSNFAGAKHSQSLVKSRFMAK